MPRAQCPVRTGAVSARYGSEVTSIAEPAPAGHGRHAVASAPPRWAYSAVLAQCPTGVGRGQHNFRLDEGCKANVQPRPTSLLQTDLRLAAQELVTQGSEVVSVAEYTWRIDDVLSVSPAATDRLLSAIPPLSAGDRLVLDLDAVTWVRPYGAVMLLGLCRFLSSLTGHAVGLTKVRSAVHAYLVRIDFFTAECVYAANSLNPSFLLSRSAASSNVLELVSLDAQDDVYEVIERARRILGYWLSVPARDTDRLVSLLSEACANVVDHSGDRGVVTIQKYEYRDAVDVELAISDLGVGIRGSLQQRHPDVRDTVAGYIQRALDGLSARAGNRGGHGLGAIRRIATSSGGILHVRSETGSVFTRGGIHGVQTVCRDALASFPGTQLAITFRSTVTAGS